MGNFIDTSALETELVAIREAARSEVDELRTILGQFSDVRGETVLIAAYDAPESMKKGADIVCEGHGDEYPINEAIVGLGDYGGTIRLSEGSFDFNAVLDLTKDSVRLVGSGVGARSGASQPIGGTFITGAIQVKHPSNSRPLYGVELRDFTVESPGDGITFCSNAGLIEHVHAHRCVGAGIRIWGYDGIKPFHPYDTTVRGCYLTHGGDDGLIWDVGSADNHASGNVICKNAGAGIRIRSGGGQIRGGQVYDNDRNIVFEGGSQVQVQNGKYENALRECFYLDASLKGPSYAMITGNGFRFNGKSETKKYPVIGGGGNKAVIGLFVSGNRFNSDIGPTSPVKEIPSWAVDIWGQNCQNWKVVTNQYGQPVNQHFGSGTVQNHGLNCIVETV